MNKQRIEVFTAGCPVCQPVIDLVKSLANEEFNELIVYDLVKKGETTECLSKLEEYGVKKLPAIAINGQLLDCCINNAITKEDLLVAGLTEKN